MPNTDVTTMLQSHALDPKSMDVLARVAHEMRQPLSAATAAVIVIKEGVDTERREHACRVLERQCVRLFRLLEDLVVIARAGRDVTTLKKEPMDLNSVLFDLTDALQPLVALKGQHLDVLLAPEPCWIDGDAARLDQVFSNILTNSIKYTDAGGRIWIAEVLTDEGAVITIGDTGCGIPPDVLPRVFDMFMPGSNHAGRGLGVGLAVARYLVDLHGGSIHVASDGDGCGTEAVVRLPRLRMRH